MLTTPHVLLGLFFASNFPPVVALPAALISHFLFDFYYPHWNPHLFTEMKKHGHLSQKTLGIIIVDLLVALSFLAYILIQVYPNSQQMLVFILAAFLSIAPDLIEAPYYFFKSKNPLLKRMVTFEHLHQANANPFWGSLSQLLVIALCWWQI
jgi:hypothetical protein